MEIEPDIPENEMQRIAEAVETMSSDSALKRVKESLDELKVERQEYKEVISIFLGV